MTSSAAAAGEERARRCAGCLLYLLSLVGFTLLLVGATLLGTRESARGYVCGDDVPSPFGDGNHLPSCLRINDGRVRGAELAPDGPLCPRADAPGVYCYERLEGRERPTAYLWFTCEEGSGDEGALFDTEVSNQNVAECSLGSWRIFHTRDNDLADQYGWFRKSALDVSGGGWQYRDASIDNGEASEKAWADAPFLSVSVCDSGNHTNSTQNEASPIPEECFAEKVWHKETSSGDALFHAGIVLFCLPFLCAGLGCIFTILGMLAVGILNLLIGLRGGSFHPALKGLFLTTATLAVILALVDIGLKCAEMFLTLPFSTAFVGFLVAILWNIAEAIKMACIKRWGIILKADVRGKKRHRNKRDDGTVTYEHKLLVTYEVSNHVRPTLFGYRGVRSSVEEPVPTGGEEHTATIKESNDLPRDILDTGSPVQPGLGHLEEKTAIWSKRRIRKWLSVGQSQYDNSGTVVEVSVLPGFPTVAATAENLSKYSKWEHATVLIICALFAAGMSVPGVFAAHEMFFGDDCCDSCTLWHVKASYVALATLLPLSVALVLALPNPTNRGGTDWDPSDEGQELSTLGLQSEPGTVETDEATWDLSLEEEEADNNITARINASQDKSLELPSIT